MTDGDVTSATVARVASAAFSDKIEQDAVEIVPGDDGASLEIQANQWTLAMEGEPLDVAFLAVDDEPTSEAEMANALEMIVGHGDLSALRQINQQLGDQLATALRNSGDPLSMRLASTLG